MKLQTYIYENEICNEINDYINYFDDSFWKKYTSYFDGNPRHNGGFGDCASAKRDVIIALNICTYHRKEYICRNLCKLKKSKFFDRHEPEYYSHLHIFITDNAGEWKESDEEFIHIKRNPLGNTGGSGGFQYGLECIRNCGIRFTNVIFMDDDVDFILETFYRIFALLSYIRDEYSDVPVAGRMFCKDRPYIQYTAAEIWNKGEINHIGFQLDMRDSSNFISLNDNENAEYGGWWFCCYPMEYVENNNIMPYFIHCDDVEYGLRNGKKPILLNGIQVWHETFEFRRDPVMLYYDRRNTYFLNRRYHFMEIGHILEQWKKEISLFHKERKWIEEYMVIMALRDFCRGEKWLFSVDGKNNHRRICRMKTMRWKNSFAWRIVEWYCKHNFKRLFFTPTPDLGCFHTYVCENPEVKRVTSHGVNNNCLGILRKDI